MWDLLVSIPDHCLSFYFPVKLSGLSQKTSLYSSFSRALRVNSISTLSCANSLSLNIFQYCSASL